MLPSRRWPCDLESTWNAFTAGEISFEHVNQVRALHDREDDEILRKGEELLVTLARQSDPDTLRRACD